MSVGKKRSYYDIIAGLAAFECSQEVTFNRHDLQELVKQPTESQSVTRNTEDETRRKRTIVHGYLGGKVDINEASNASYDLSHTLLGGYVPKRQLESLSSIDFAHYFHKSLECEDALQVYDLFVGTGYGRIPAHINGQVAAPVEAATARDSRLESPAKSVRKVVVCKRCGARAHGPRRVQELENHVCNRRSRA